MFFTMIFDAIYFRGIKTAIFYKKSTIKMFKCNFFRFLDLQGYFDKNKK